MEKKKVQKENLDNTVKRDSKELFLLRAYCVRAQMSALGYDCNDLGDVQMERLWIVPMWRKHLAVVNMPRACRAIIILRLEGLAEMFRKHRAPNNYSENKYNKEFILKCIDSISNTIEQDEVEWAIRPWESTDTHSSWPALGDDAYKTYEKKFQNYKDKPDSIQNRKVVPSTCEIKYGDDCDVYVVRNPSAETRYRILSEMQRRGIRVRKLEGWAK